MLTVDTNEHVVKGKLSKKLRNLGVVEAYCNKFKSEGPSSCFRDRNQIDRVCFTCNIVPTSVAMCPFYFGARDHRPFTVDFQVESILGCLALIWYSSIKRLLTCPFPNIFNLCL